MITKGKLEDAIEKRLIIQLSKVTKGEIRRRNQRMTNNTIVKRYQRGNQKT
jgi:hypothetical protein